MCGSKPKIKYTPPVTPAAPAATLGETQQPTLDNEGTPKKKRSAGKRSLMIKPQSFGVGVNI